MMKKRLLALLLAVTLTFGILPTVWAVETDPTEATECTDPTHDHVDETVPETTAAATDPVVPADADATQPTTEATEEPTVPETIEETVSETTQGECICDMESDEHNEDCPLYAPMAEAKVYTAEADGMEISIAAPDGAFPQGTVLQVTPLAVMSRSRSNPFAEYVDDDATVLTHYMMDISFYNGDESQQPQKAVVMTFDLPASMVPAEANVIYVFHITDEGEAERVTKVGVTDATTAQTISVEVDGFSSYAVVLANQKYTSKLMRDVLSNNSRYSIVTFPATLYDYDGPIFNKYASTSAFNFTVGDAGNGINGGAPAATQGIVKTDLVNGVPVMSFGKDVGGALFAPSSNSSVGKTVYNGVNFEFVYDKTTGYYEYNSTANHAQYNSSNKKIELYADTLSPLNTNIELSGFATHNATLTTNAAGNYVYKTTGGDPHIRLTGLNHNIADYSKVYIRMKSNVTQRAQIFFDIGSGYKETDSVVLTLQKDNWADYIFDVTKIATSGTIRAMRIDLADNSGATIEISDIGIMKVSGTNSTGTYNYNVHKGGFYPFAKINNSYAGVGNQFDYTAWTRVIGSPFALKDATRAYSNASGVTTNGGADLGNEPLYYYGVAMETNFYIPESKRVDGKEIMFSFTGDDDMWVFIDGKLALDIGGGHSAISGNINFTSGKAYVEKARQATSVTNSTPSMVSGSHPTYSSKTTTLSSELTKPGYHTMKIFYLERARGAANCLIRFNMPKVPTGNVVVSKTVSGVTANDVSHTFKITSNGSNLNGANYTIMEGSKQVGTGTTSNGVFTLKHGQSAIFSGIAEKSTVRVEETTAGAVSGATCTGTKVNNKNQKYDQLTTTANGVINFNFVNTYTENNATIYYKVVGNVGGLVNPAQETLKARTGTASGSTATPGTGYKFVGWYADEACTKSLGTNPKYTPTRPANGWVNGTTYWAKFEELTVPIHYEVVGPAGCGTVDLNDGNTTGAMTSTTETVKKMTGNALGATAAANKNFTFVGWFDDKNCTGAPISTDESYIPTRPASGGWAETIYYAKFEYAVADLVITKTVDQANPDQSFLFNVTNEEGLNIPVVIPASAFNGGTTASVTVKDLEVGTYTVTEDTSWSWRYNLRDVIATTGKNKVSVTDGIQFDLTPSGETVTFSNKRSNIYWFDGETYADNAFAKKTGN